MSYIKNCTVNEIGINEIHSKRGFTGFCLRNLIELTLNN